MLSSLFLPEAESLRENVFLSSPSLSPSPPCFHNSSSSSSSRESLIFNSAAIHSSILSSPGR